MRFQIFAGVFVFSVCCALVCASGLDASFSSKSVTEETVSFPGPVIECDVCEAAVTLVGALIQMNYTLDEMEGPFIDLCTRLVFPTSNHPMCPGLIKAYAPSVVFVMSSTVLSPNELCSQLRYCNSSDAPRTIERLPQRLNVHDEKLNAFVASRTFPARRSKPSKTKPSSAVKSAAQTLRVLQLTDFHYDAQYTAGAYADCGDIDCCRSNDSKGTRLAGPFGDYLCDIPQSTAENLLQFAANMPQPPDVVLWTGDNPAHDMWMETPASQLASSTNVTQMVRKYFPHTPVFPVYGNHEAFPANLYYQPTFGWLTQGLADMWKPLLSADAYETMKIGGFYTMLIKPGVRVIVLNSQLGYVFNFYTFLVDHPLADQMFAWLENLLVNARAQNERVLLVGHIPPGREDVNDFYALRYLDLSQRYADVITAHYSGHTHCDSFEVIRDATNTKPIGAIYIAPSVTTFWHINPSFRVYELDATTWNVLDYEQYHMNMTRSNAEGHVTWELFYTATELWGIPDLSPQSWQLVSDAIGAEPNAGALYQYVLNTAVFPSQNCDALCQHMSKCETASATFEMYGKCLLSP